MHVRNVLAHVAVADHDEAVQWYTRLFGRSPDRTSIGGPTEWQLTPAGALQLSPHSELRPTTVVLDIDDLDETVEQVAERGMSLEIVDELGARFRMASIADPWGNTITFAHENAMTFS